MLGVMDSTTSFAEATHRPFDNLSVQLQRSSNVTFDDDDDIIELANYLTKVGVSDSNQEPTLQW
jgi:hypothetical protein